MGTVPVMRTWVTGEIVTAAFLNSNVRDLGNFLLNPPLAVLRQTSAQTIGNASWTGILQDTEDKDSDNAHSTVSNTSRITPATPGYYWLISEINMSGSSSTGSRHHALQANGSTRYGKTDNTAIAGGTNTALAAAACLFANGTSDYFEAVVFQNSGGNLSTVVTDDGNPRFQALWVSN